LFANITMPSLVGPEVSRGFAERNLAASAATVFDIEVSGSIEHVRDSEAHLGDA
jgi:hypothetical protein